MFKDDKFGFVGMMEMIKTIEECFFQIQNGANIKQGDMDGGFPITRIETTANDKFNRDRMGYAGITDISKYELYILEDGDLLMSHINSTQYLGRTVLYVKQPNETIIHGMNLLRLKARRDIIDPAYARYCFCGHPFRSQIGNITKKSVNQASFAVKDLKQIIIDIPTVPEQLGIVEILDKIQQIIELRTDEMAKLDNLIKARFVEMFGDTLTNPLGWKEHRLDEYIDFLTSGSRGWAQYFVDEENELFITIKNVKNNHIILENIQYINAPNNKEAERTKVKTGDLLISITADLGRTGVVDEDIAERGAYINQHLSLVRLNQSKIRPLYVSHFLETEGGKMQFESKNQNGVKAGLNFDAIKSLKILVPPLEMQLSYLNFAHQVDKSKVAVQKALDETQLLFDSLMQQYFG